MSWRSLLYLLLMLGCERRSEPPRKAPRAKPVASSLPATSAGKTTPRALALAWTGWATLPFEAERLRRDHTLFVRFLPAFEGAYRGVLVADQSGSYRVGLAPFASLSQPAVEVSFGGVTFTGPLPKPVLSNHDLRFGAPPQPLPRWLTLTVSVRGTTARVYLNDAPLGSLELETRDFAGLLQLGRLARAEAVQDQFYGFIDDVAVFERALDEPEVRALVRTPRIEPRLDGLAFLATFDVGSAPEATLHGTAELSVLSGAHDARLDAARLPRPAGVPRLTLPFVRDQVWMVIQGINSAHSHHDTATFAVDFQRVDPGLLAHNPERKPGASPKSSLGQPFLAVADGRIVSRVDCFLDDQLRPCAGLKTEPDAEPARANRNLVCVEHATGIASCYLHLTAKSIRGELGSAVKAGDVLARVGRSGTREAHLHFALSDRAEPNQPGAFADLTTVPFEFSHYEASDDLGRSWQRIEAGTPRPGQWLRSASAW